VALLSPTQLLWRGRIETGIRLTAPVLDLVLAVGDRISRAVDRDPPELIPSGRLAADAQPVLPHGRD
jgi:hypothetical protein